MIVKIYKTAACPFCHMETEWLKEKNVTFTEVYVDRDPAKAEEIAHKSGQLGVPVTEIADGGKTDYILGFDQAKLSQLLKLA